VTSSLHHRGAFARLGLLLLVDVAVFLLQKAASGDEPQGASDVLRHAAASPLLWLALILAPVQLWLWTQILERSDIGWAYALTSFAYPLTMLFASVLWRERYDAHVWVGALLITAGVLVLGPQHRTGPSVGDPSSGAA
jgi:drug/metabolite transporter (DMT)-like permease